MIKFKHRMEKYTELKLDAKQDQSKKKKKEGVETPDSASLKLKNVQWKKETVIESTLNENSSNLFNQALGSRDTKKIDKAR